MRDEHGRYKKGVAKSANWYAAMAKRTGSGHAMWKGGQKTEIVNCGCGCGTPMNRYDSRNRTKKRIQGHQMRGRKQSKYQKWSLTGERNPLWQGGRSRYYHTGYYSTAYKEWRKNVFERDNYTCQGCDQHGGYLTAHHIKSQAQYPELQLVLENGQTLCEPCHSETDNYKGRGIIRSLSVNR